MPQQEEIIRHVCVEGWDYIGQWSGVPLGTFLRRVGADLSAKYVAFKTADDLPQQHRHGDRAASPDPARPAIRPRNPAGPVRLPAAAAHVDQAGLQEPEMDHRHRGVEHIHRRVIGNRRASTGSAGFERGTPASSSLDSPARGPGPCFPSLGMAAQDVSAILVGSDMGEADIQRHHATLVRKAGRLPAWSNTEAFDCGERHEQVRARPNIGPDYTSTGLSVVALALVFWHAICSLCPEADGSFRSSNVRCNDIVSITCFLPGSCFLPATTPCDVYGNIKKRFHEADVVSRLIDRGESATSSMKSQKNVLVSDAKQTNRCEIGAYFDTGGVRADKRSVIRRPVAARMRMTLRLSALRYWRVYSASDP